MPRIKYVSSGSFFKYRPTFIQFTRSVLYTSLDFCRKVQYISHDIRIKRIVFSSPTFFQNYGFNFARLIINRIFSTSPPFKESVILAPHLHSSSVRFLCPFVRTLVAKNVRELAENHERLGVSHTYTREYYTRPSMPIDAHDTKFYHLDEFCVRTVNLVVHVTSDTART